jgi:hypothetical protein
LRHRELAEKTKNVQVMLVEEGTKDEVVENNGDNNEKQ